MKIEKKIRIEYFESILSGKKNFELRLADFECQEGDILVLREWNHEKRDYTGRSLEKEVKYVAKTKGIEFFSKEDIEKYGYQVIGF